MPKSYLQTIAEERLHLLLWSTWQLDNRKLHLGVSMYSCDVMAEGTLHMFTGTAQAGGWTQNECHSKTCTGNTAD
jgi:hypothetical protein